MPRHRLALAAWLTILALPILLIDNIPRRDAGAEQAQVEVDPGAADAASAVVVTLPPSTTAPPTTEAPTTAAAAVAEAVAAPAPTTAKPKPVVTTTTTAKPRPTTTTTTPPPPPEATLAPANSQDGGASWYDYRPGECAHVSIPKGTVVTVTSLSSGASTTCTVTDRGPYGGGRIIDLDRATFAQLAPPSVGIIQVRITW